MQQATLERPRRYWKQQSPYYKRRETICVFCGELAWCRIQKRKKYRNVVHVPLLVCGMCAQKAKSPTSRTC